MLDRLLMTVVLFGGLGLLWLGWRYYKSSLVQHIQPATAPTGKPTLLYFTADYCTACKFQQSPIIQQLVDKLGQAIAVAKYDVTQHPDLASRYKVLTLPTTVVVSAEGQVAHINYGVTQQAKLEKQLTGTVTAKETNSGSFNELQHNF